MEKNYKNELFIVFKNENSICVPNIRSFIEFSDRIEFIYEFKGNSRRGIVFLSEVQRYTLPDNIAHSSYKDNTETITPLSSAKKSDNSDKKYHVSAEFGASGMGEGMSPTNADDVLRFVSNLIIAGHHEFHIKTENLSKDKVSDGNFSGLYTHKDDRHIVSAVVDENDLSLLSQEIDSGEHVIHTYHLKREKGESNV